MNRFQPIHIFILIVVYGFIYQVTAQPFPDSVLSINDEKYKVDSIKIVGNDITEDFIILRELTFKEDDVVTSSQLNYNRERVFSLGLFSKVSVYPVLRGPKTFIYIDVSETWYIYPIPFLRRSDKASNSYSYGINFTFKNFRGRNEDIKAIVSLGYDPHFLLLYDNPALLYDEDLGISVGLSYLNSQNKSVKAKTLYGDDFDNRYYSASVSLFKRLDQFNQVSLISSFDYIKVPDDKYFYGMSASGHNIDRSLGLGFGYWYDTRDLKQFPQTGIFLGLLYLHKGFGINDINYNTLYLDYSQYEKLVGNLITRWRLATRIAFGNIIPFYDYSYLGYNEYVRGHSNNIREGNTTVISSFELSYPVVKEFDFSIKLPLLPRKLTSARIGLFITAFADAGNAFDNKYRIRLSDFYAGYGGGITVLILPYNAMRFEYAINEQGNGEFLIGAGFAF